MSGKPIVEMQQIELDLEEAEAKLRIIAAAVDKRDHFRVEVARLRRELAQAKQALKESEWDVGACAQRVAQHIKRRAKG